MKTITIFCREYPPVQSGGLANTGKYLIEELKKRKDYKINLITLKYGKYKNLPSYEKDKNISIYRIPIWKDMFCWYRMFLFTQFNKKLIKNSDLIHSLNARDCPFIYTGGKPFISNINDYLPSQIPINPFGRFKLVNKRKFAQYVHYNYEKLLDFISLKRSTHIIHNSKFLERYLTKYYGLKNKSSVVYKGIDFNDFKNKKSKKDIDILFLANKLGIKGAKEFLHALAIVKKEFPNLKVVMVGKPCKIDINYFNLIKKLGLAEIVELKDSIPREEVFDYYLRSKMYVLPTYCEGLGQCAIEAYAAKIPVIGTKVGGLPEIIGKNGILVEPKTIKPFSSAMIRLLKNKSLRERMGLEGFKRNRKIFNFKEMVDGYIEIYDGVLKK